MADIKMWALLLLVPACVAPVRATLRAEAASRLGDCIKGEGMPQRARCLRESVAWCRDNKLEDACGSDNLWGKR